MPMNPPVTRTTGRLRTPISYRQGSNTRFAGRRRTSAAAARAANSVRSPISRVAFTVTAPSLRTGSNTAGSGAGSFGGGTVADTAGV